MNDFRRQPRDFHELRQTLQHIFSQLGDGGGSAGKWHIVWPPIQPGQRYDASFGDLVTASSEVESPQTAIVLPVIDADHDGTEIAVVTGVSRSRGSAGVTVIASGGDRINPYPPSGGDTSVSLVDLWPHPGAAQQTKTFTASFEAGGWFVRAHMSGAPEA